METKTCTKCGTNKPVTEFSRKVANVKGINTVCKQCTRNNPSSEFREATKDFRPDMFQTLCSNCNMRKGKNGNCDCGTKVITQPMYEDYRDG
jgi:hypothetical protein